MHGLPSCCQSEFREKISTQIEKAMEPPPARMEKALPRPDDAHPKKRAGKRYVCLPHAYAPCTAHMPSVRRMKERYILTETRKQANRMTFGKVRLRPNLFTLPLLNLLLAQIEEDIIQEEMGYSTGQLNEDTGHVRATQQKQKKIGLTKRLQVCCCGKSIPTIRTDKQHAARNAEEIDARRHVHHPRGCVWHRFRRIHAVSGL